MDRRWLASVVGVLGTVVAANGGCSSASSPPGGAQASQVVGAAGGTVTSADGNAQVDIPAGALSGDTTITIKQNVSAPTPSGAIAVGTPYSFEPDGLTFLQPITVTLAFDPSKLATGATAGSIVVYTAPDGSSTYAPLPTTPKDATHVTATTTHFCTDTPAIGGPAMEGDGGGGDGGADGGTSLDSGPGCGLPICSGSPSSCSCNETCAGHTYAMACTTGGTCQCTLDGADTTSFSAGRICGSGGTSASSTFEAECGVPGGGSTDAGDDGDAGGSPDSGPACGTINCGGGGSTCNCSETCGAQTYAMTCTIGGNCQCTLDGASTTSFATAQTCGSGASAQSAFDAQCGPAAGGVDAGGG